MNTAAAVRIACSNERRISGARQPAARDADQKRAGRADAARLGRREQAAIEAADHEDEQQQRRPDVAQTPRGAPSRYGAARRAGIPAAAGR